jgi:hypothetical protein
MRIVLVGSTKAPSSACVKTCLRENRFVNCART